MILFFEKCFFICVERMILFVLCLNVVLLVRICCLINCCVKVDFLDELMLVVFEISVCKIVLGI